jgi:hypothetical protein
MSFFNFFKEDEISKIKNKEPRELTELEIEFLTDYFHNQTNCPDYDGFVGDYTLPKEVSERYNIKYGEERGW